MKKYDIIYSIGSACPCASYLNDNKLRSFSGPFDWLCLDNNDELKVRTELINNNFLNFLNIEDLKIIENGDITQPKRYNCYKNIRNNFSFLHDFEKDVPLESSFPLVKEKYNRRINRFYDKINNNARVLLVWLSQNRKTSNKDVIKYTNQIINKFDKKIDFLIIENDEDKKDGNIEKIVLNENVIRYNLLISNIDKCEELDNIFKQYQLINKQSLISKFIIMFAIKFLCLFVSKQQRHKLRNIYKGK